MSSAHALMIRRVWLSSNLSGAFDSSDGLLNFMNTFHPESERIDTSEALAGWYRSGSEASSSSGTEPPSCLIRVSSTVLKGTNFMQSRRTSSFRVGDDAPKDTEPCREGLLTPSKSRIKFTERTRFSWMTGRQAKVCAWKALGENWSWKFFNTVDLPDSAWPSKVWCTRKELQNGLDGQEMESHLIEGFWQCVLSSVVVPAPHRGHGR